ncbi:hypothetical protein [Streptomyces virginiae]|uniref:hypothetical protein n=1 Tax=Streptomyces virginiae TaxID=1961 RepID=UPI0038698845|nr:hypothetical protein OG253_40130 [Streptomyces virginiae]
MHRRVGRGGIDDALERADHETFTREPPKTLKARINFLMGKLKTIKAVAAELGVSQRSVERATAPGNARRR